MKRANNIIELFQNLNPAFFLKQEHTEFYVPLYEKEIGAIKVELINGLETYKTIYVSGQPGSGKTTALNFLPDESVHERFVIEYFYVQEVLGDGDIDVVDILLMLCYGLVRDNEELKLEIGKRIKNIGEQLRGELEISQESAKDNAASVEGGIGLSLPSFFRLFGGNANVEANYKYNLETRNAVRRVLKPKLEDLLALLNEIIAKYLDNHTATNKQLLLFMHDLNHSSA